ncbi:MAG: TlyA family RNA methyltransferase [Chloroflexota bacterium]|nr:TlyA family RNA methyltransferase [Chloroflexota bacterium]
MSKAIKKRLDVLLVERGLAESRAQAQRLIRAGLVRVAGQVSDKPGTQVMTDTKITLQATPRFVSRGGEKLEAALARFGLDVTGMVAADVGASTGGFTDCLLQHGASRVYAIDVGYGQLAWRLRNDPRVVVMERTNARYLESLPEMVSLITADASFISLELILPAAVGWLAPTSVGGSGGKVIALIKPQFEAGRREVGKGGVVRDRRVHRSVLERVLGIAAELGLGLRGLMPSPLRGPAGNVEFLGWWELGVARPDDEKSEIGTEATIAACMLEVETER